MNGSCLMGIDSSNYESRFIILITFNAIAAVQTKKQVLIIFLIRPENIINLMESWSVFKVVVVMLYVHSSNDQQVTSGRLMYTQCGMAE